MAVSSVLQSIVGDLQRLGLVQAPGGGALPTGPTGNALATTSYGGGAGAAMPRINPDTTGGPPTPVPAQQPPPGQNPFDTGGGGTDSTQHPYTYTAPDGTVYIWDDSAGTYKPAPGIPGGKGQNDIPIVTPNPYSGFQDWLGPPTRGETLPPNDPRAQQAIIDARGRYLDGSASESDLNTLMAANEISPSDVRQFYKDYGGGGGSYDPSGMANVGARYAELAEQVRHQRAAEALDAAQAADARIKMAQDARLAAARYAVTPSMRASGYFPGFEANSPLVRAGLANPISFQPQQFNPSLGSTLDPAQLQRDLAAIRGG